MRQFCWGNLEIAEDLRLNPCDLPKNITYKGQPYPHAVTCYLKEDKIYTSVRAQDNVVGFPKHLPLQEFKGILATIIKTKTNARAILLLLLHEDEAYNIPLLVSRDLNNVLLDWRLWADMYDLPMLLMQQDGFLSQVYEKQYGRAYSLLDYTRQCKNNMLFLRGCACVKLMVEGKSLTG